MSGLDESSLLDFTGTAIDGDLCATDDDVYAKLKKLQV